jgi:hypothetical protein
MMKTPYEIFLSETELLTGEIYDLCNLAEGALRDEGNSRSNGIRFLIREIKDRNTQINRDAFTERDRQANDGQIHD